MALKVLLAATLRRFVKDYDPMNGLSFSMERPMTVGEVAEMLGIPEDEIKLIMVNGRAASEETRLQGHERVAFFPPVGGG